MRNKREGAGTPPQCKLFEAVTAGHRIFIVLRLCHKNKPILSQKRAAYFFCLNAMYISTIVTIMEITVTMIEIISSTAIILSCTDWSPAGNRPQFALPFYLNMSTNASRNRPVYRGGFLLLQLLF